MIRNQHAIFEVIQQIGVISLNAPPGNELDIPEFIQPDFLMDWINNNKIKGLIFKGIGKNFSSGGNLKNILAASNNPIQLRKLMEDGHRLFQNIGNLNIPVIAAIERVCFGGGLELALCCHIRVVSENALFAFPEVNKNLMPGLGGIYRISKLTSVAESCKILLGGDTLNAVQAKQIGIANYIAPKNKSFESALSLMSKMVKDRPLKVINSIMTALKNAEILPVNEAIEEEIKLFCELVHTEAESRSKEEV